jgi:two-component system nitrogen regulation sensor histidine kinase GlnL
MEIIVPSIVNLLTALVCLSLGILVLLRNRRKVTHQTFALLAFNLMIWALSVFFVVQSVTTEWATFWIHVAEITVCFIPAFLYRFIGYFPRGHFDGNKKLLYGLFIFGFVQSSLSFTPGYIKNIQIHEMPPAPPTVEHSDLLILIGIAAIVVLIATIGNLRRKAKETHGFGRRQVQFVMTGCYCIAIFGTLAAFIEPVLGIPSFQAYGPIWVMLFMGCFSYAMVRYHLLDTRAFISKLAIYLGAAGFMILTMLLIHQLTMSVLPKNPNLTFVISTIISAMIISLVFQTVKNKVERFIEVTILSQRYDVDRLYRRISSQAAEIEGIDNLLPSVAEDIQLTIGVRTIRVLLNSPDDPKLLTTAFTTLSDEPVIHTREHNILLDFLREHPRPLLLEKILHRHPDERMVRIARHLANLDAYFCLPLITTSGLVGILTLGQKNTHDMYSTEEEIAFRALAGPLGTAITNARLYQTVEELSLHQANVLSQMREGVIAVNYQGVVTMVNDAASAMIGSTAKGQSIDHLKPEIAELLIRTLDLGIPISDFESVLKDPEGEIISVIMSSSPLKTPTGENTGAIALIYDLSQIKRLEKNVQRADRLSSIGTLAAGMAHEIKNPLVSIKTFTQLLMDRYDDPDFQETFRDVVPHEVNRIDTIVSRLLDFARPRPIKFQPQNIHRLIDEVLALVENQTRKGFIKVIRDFPSEDLHIIGDEQQLHQVFLNLILNAVDAMESKREGTLTIATSYSVLTTQSADGSGIPDTIRCIKIVIKDTGCGISEKALSNLFTPFFTTKDEGCGLGLSVVHGIISEHGGEIDVQSTPGEGTAFSLAIPMAESLYSTTSDEHDTNLKGTI